VPRARISACLIVQNERERLPAALASVAFCDEVLVVDGGSTDDTAERARAAGARVIEHPWRGFAIQRNVAIDAAHGDWILEVDADERVSPALRTSIEALLAQPPEDVAMAVCALRNRFLGGLLGPSAKYPAYRSRLFRRGAYRHDESLTVHEGLEPRERPTILAGDLEHELAATLREALLDTWRYARLESRCVPRPRAPGAYLKGIVLRPAAKLCYRTVVDGGWRDGWRGLLKIALDVGSDTLVWVRVLVRPGPAPAPPPGGGGEHFGRRRAGPVRIVAVSDRGRSTERAVRWLSTLQRRGADVALICEEPVPSPDLPQQTVARIGPLAIARALDVERQVRVVDAVVPFGRRARLVHRVLPATLRPAVAGVDCDVDPDLAFELARAAAPQ
jgi:glycosyl transferase family 2